MKPSRPVPQDWAATATSALTIGDPMDVPPTEFQPAAQFWVQTPWPEPVKYWMNPVSGSALAERSGTIRIVAPAGTPGATCHDGRDQRVDTPPPPAPGLPDFTGVFHTVWLRGLMSFTVRPPTPVT